MNMLLRNGIRLNWPLSYIGLINKWISPNEIVDAAFKGQFSIPVDEETLVDFEINKDNFESFKRLVQVNFEKLGKEDGLNWAKDVWQLAFLLEVKKSNKNLDEKFVDIIELWEMFGYRSEWESFINILPAKEGEPTGTQSVYSNFLSYIDSEFKRLLRQSPSSLSHTGI